MTDSLKVADAFGKRHDRVIRSIENILNDSPQKWGQCFKPSFYEDSSGKKNKMYLMNEKAFSVLVMGFTGKKALEWKWKYADAFEQMRLFIAERHTQEWIETRKQGKLTRRSETDVIKQLVEYAKNQGSSHADMLYVTYSRLANKMAGIENGRDNATIYQLNNLDLCEHVILHIIRAGITGNLHYKEIYQHCKSRLGTIHDLAYLDARR